MAKIRITIDSDEAGAGVSTIAAYLTKCLKNIFNEVELKEPEMINNIRAMNTPLGRGYYSRCLAAVQEKDPTIEVQAHPRLAVFLEKSRR